MIQADSLGLDQSIVRQAAQVLESGGLVVFPTETVYGIAASVRSDKGLAALRAFKGRADNEPFTVHMPNTASAGRYADLSTPWLKRFIGKVLPGPVTVVLEVPELVIESRLKGLGLGVSDRNRLYHGNTIGLRCPDLMLAQQVLGSIPSAVVASSANRHRCPAPCDVHEAVEAVGDQAQMIIDGGRCRFAKPSTIVRVQQNHGVLKWTVQRAGVYDERFMQKLTRSTILMVCTGNTCRSAMAQGFAEQILSQSHGVISGELEPQGIKVLSAGTSAIAGMPASEAAIEVMSQEGIDLSRHRSKPLTAQLIHEADQIYCMTQSHKQSVLQINPTAADKIQLMDPAGDVDDPIGMDFPGYHCCAQQIYNLLIKQLKEQFP